MNALNEVALHPRARQLYPAVACFVAHTIAFVVSLVVLLVIVVPFDALLGLHGGDLVWLSVIPLFVWIGTIVLRKLLLLEGWQMDRLLAGSLITVSWAGAIPFLMSDGEGGQALSMAWTGSLLIACVGTALLAHSRPDTVAPVESAA